MKSHLLPAAFAVAVSLVGMIQPDFGQSLPQPDPTVEASGDALFVRWDGVPERTYFVRTSSDLEDWTFLPEIEYGEGPYHYGFESSEDDFFVQVLCTDESALWEGEINPAEADFDGDGLPSLFELLNGFNPLDSETIDGIPDGSGDLEEDGRIDRDEVNGFPSSHPSRVDNPKVKLVVEVLN